MAISNTKINANLITPYRHSGYTHHLFFVQTYAMSYRPEDEISKDTYWYRIDFKDEGSLVNALKNRPGIIDQVKSKLAADAVRMHFIGRRVLDFAISVNGSMSGYTVDSFDMDTLVKVCKAEERRLQAVKNNIKTQVVNSGPGLDN
jgi:hypothetical protein